MSDLLTEWAKEALNPNPSVSVPAVTRFEVITEEQGRVMVCNNVKVEFSFQDDARTLKIFISRRQDATRSGE